MYTPAADYHGHDSFTFLANDGQVDSLSATASLVILATPDAPRAATDQFFIEPGQSLAVSFPDGVLANDTGLGDGGIVVAIETDGTFGTATSNGDGTVTYVPDAEFHGEDSYTYSVTDAQGDSDTATVTVTVVSQNDQPATVADSTIIDSTATPSWYSVT